MWAPGSVALLAGSGQLRRMAPLANPSSEIVDHIVAAARVRLAEGGFRALTFRPLAQDCGVTVAVLTYHFGVKARLVEDLVAAERAIDLAAHARFAARYAPLERLEPEALSSILEAWLEEAAGPWAITSRIFAELLLRAGADPEAQAAVVPWIEERQAFWRAFFAGRREAPEAWGLAVLGFLTDETIHSLAQGNLADYRLLRRMAAERLAGGFPVVPPGLAQPAMFEAAVARLDPALALPDPGAPAELPKGRGGHIARAAAVTIMLDGADAVTHRAVGLRAGAAASTVAYHFQTQLDLLRAGLATIYLVAQDRVSLADGLDPRIAVAVGTASVALLASRDRALTPFAIDLRRQRGVNLHNRLQILGAEGRRFDLCGAQALSVATLGATLLTYAQGRRETDDSLFSWLVGDLSGN